MGELGVKALEMGIVARGIRRIRSQRQQSSAQEVKLLIKACKARKPYARTVVDQRRGFKQVFAVGCFGYIAKAYSRGCPKDLGNSSGLIDLDQHSTGLGIHEIGGVSHVAHYKHPGI